MNAVRNTPTVDVPGRPCAVAAGLQLVGDRWSLLIVRELLFGNHRFGQLARNTGAPRDRLAARLRDLEANGVIERRQYNEHPPRFEYHLTSAGHDLAPVIHALRAWGDRWAVDEPPAVFRHTCGHPVEPEIMCARCGRPVPADEMVVESLVPGWDRRSST
jgi:DNA-binding HxlR family transcriptional regulator